MNYILRYISTLGPIGFIPFAPGTFGSLAGLICLWLLPLSDRQHLLAIMIGAFAGSVAATSAEKQFRHRDSQRIVIDEFIGYYVSVFMLPRSAGVFIAAFLLFRFFDIFKPLMIRKVESALRNGKGVMADDILAGIYSNILIRAYLLLSSS